MVNAQVWKADPNAPEPQVSAGGPSVNVRFNAYRVVQDNELAGVSLGATLFWRTSPKFDETWGTFKVGGCTYFGKS
jgi:hypothetical protein